MKQKRQRPCNFHSLYLCRFGYDEGVRGIYPSMRWETHGTWTFWMRRKSTWHISSPWMSWEVHRTHPVSMHRGSTRSCRMISKYSTWKSRTVIPNRARSAETKTTRYAISGLGRKWPDKKRGRRQNLAPPASAAGALSRDRREFPIERLLGVEQLRQRERCTDRWRIRQRA